MWTGAGGASGAIYTKLNLNNPDDPKESDLKLEATKAETKKHKMGGETRTVIHVHSPQGQNYNTLDEFIDALTTSYENVIDEFIKTDKTTLALCPISGGIYADKYINNTLGHLDPSITVKALAKALENKKEKLEEKTIRLYNFDKKVHKATKALIQS